MHVELGGYHVADIEFFRGFDVNATKVGKELSKAIHAEFFGDHRASFLRSATCIASSLIDRS